MSRRLVLAVVFSLVPGLALAAVIGSAQSVTKEVNGRISGAERAINPGDQVVSDEAVRTGAGSATRLKFLDDTEITIGAGSTIVLDKFVFNPDKTAQSTVIKVTKGTFRFVTGQSSPENFTLQTGVATIGIRGTDVTIVCDSAGQCSVVVTSGNVLVCPKIQRGLDGRTISQFCPEAVKLDKTNNFTTVSSGGKTTGAQQVSPAAVSSLNNAIASGQPGITTSGLSNQATGGNAPAPGTPAGQNANDQTGKSDPQTFVLTPVTGGGTGSGPVSQ